MTAASSPSSATATRTLSATRFESELLPRVIERIAALSRGTLHTEILPAGQPGLPACLRISATARTGGGRYACPLDVTLSWDGREVERLFTPDGAQRFAAYLDALPAKLVAWQEARDIDFSSRTQADATVLIGGLDFEHLLL